MRFRSCFAIGMLMLAAGCAEVPPAPSVAPSPVTLRAVPANPLAATIAAHQQRALHSRAAGDLANAQNEWHVLTLIAPDEVAFRNELAATRTAIEQVTAENLQAGNSALRAGDTERATALLLRVLAADPENAEAAHGLREIERRKLSRIQANRAAKLRQDEAAAAARPSRSPPAAEPVSSFDLEQRLAMLNAGDTAGGLRELGAFVEAHPQERAARQRIGTAVFDRGRDQENRGGLDQALTLYESAVALRGDAPKEWTARIQALRKTLSNEYYDRGTRAVRTDLAAAIKALETSVRYDPGNAKALARLAAARTAQDRLQAIDKALAPK